MLSGLKNSAQEIANSFRLGQDANANYMLAEFVDSFVKNIADLAAEMDVNKVSVVLGDIMQAQARADYIYVADLLQFELFEA